LLLRRNWSRSRPSSEVVNLAKTMKVTGIKGHEELHAHVDEEGAKVVWVRALELDGPGGEPDRGTQVPLTPANAKEFAHQLDELASYAE
jgi:hypothetical protein